MKLLTSHPFRVPLPRAISRPLRAEPPATRLFPLTGEQNAVNWHRVAAACVVATLAGCAFMGVTCLVMS